MRTSDARVRLWTHKETAEYLAISPTQLYVLNRGEGAPPSFKVGSLRRYDPIAVHTWLRKQSANKAKVAA